VAERNWRRIESAPRGIGPQLLRAGSGPNDPSYVGYQGDDGRWYAADDSSQNREVHPTHYCAIPSFDADDADGEPSA
jgi:hypothetical protein